MSGRKPALTEAEAAEVRELYADRAAKWTVTALSWSFRVSTAVIHAVLNRTGAYQRHKEVADMTVTEQMLAALRTAERCLDSQMSLNPGRPPEPYWKVLEIIRAAIKRGANLSLKDLDDELEDFTGTP